MNYFVKRGEQRLGPFSLAELQQRVATLSILPTDLAQSEGMTDWVLVSQIIGNIPVPAPSSVGNVYGASAAPAMAVETVPLPPNLHWLLLFILNVVTRGLFSLIWAIVLANWSRKLDHNDNTLVLVSMYPAGIIAGIFAISMTRDLGPAIGGLLIIGGLIAYIIGVFKIKAAMEEYYNSTENIGLKLSPVMTFFFQTTYLQFHVNKIAKWKKTGVLS
jgi:GYF domain 2